MDRARREPVGPAGDRRRPGAPRSRSARRIERKNKVSECTFHGWCSVEANTRGLLSVVENGYVYLGPQVHGDFRAAEAAVSIDVPSGRRLALGDLVISTKAFRPPAASCMKLFTASVGSGDEWWWERDMQSVPADKNGEPVDENAPTFDPRSLHEPSILVLPDGIAVLLRNQPTVSATLASRGPVVRRGALLRANALKPRSPAARPWAGEKPLPEGEAACTRVFVPRWVVSKPRG